MVIEPVQVEPTKVSQKSKVYNIKTGYDENPSINLDEDGKERQEV